jgi:hypothetical protein
MGYLQEVDRWLDVIFADLADGKMDYAGIKRDIRERILDSYRNGLAAGGRSPAPQAPQRKETRRFERRH